MKKILSILLVLCFVFCLTSCGDLEQEPEQPKTYKVGDTQTWQDISLKVKKVESGLYCGNRKSENGSWVKVYFSIENNNADYYTLSYVHFTLNDTYTIRDTYYSLTDIPSGGFVLVGGNTYEFYVIFDCKYAHTEKDLVFLWEVGGWVFGTTKEWVL